MTAGIFRIVRKLPSSPNTSGRATLTKKARAAGVKSITLNERVWKFPSDIRTFRTTIIFCLKGRMGLSRMDRDNAVSQSASLTLSPSTCQRKRESRSSRFLR
ncbi:hypothetical protein AVEN_155823-1 [Araneus ventricosus]|uniref:Uncharacterized protein n=1 Tax=Araneus ventricosus TaxID=182803 RepID=A0A4Y2G8H7_ARAVE|nr:hypothetical protein AVEN_155823-1 [Araneus ventricosus]